MGSNMKDLLFETYWKSIQEEHHEPLNVLLNSWIAIYGAHRTKLDELMDKIKNDLKAFWENQIEDIEERKKNIVKSIERSAKEAYDLEKSLHLPSKVDSMTCDDIPLIEHEEAIWQILSSYQKIKEEHINAYSELQKKEAELCTPLGEKPQLIVYYSDVPTISSDVRDSIPDVPSLEDISKAEQRVKDLNTQMEYMLNDFNAHKEQLRSVLIECEMTPFTLPEKFSFGYPTEEFQPTKQNLECLKRSINQHLKRREDIRTESIRYKEEIGTLWKKMLKDSNELDHFFQKCSQCTAATLSKLSEKLNELKAERTLKLKDLILSHRILLGELWTRCCYSEEQKSVFSAFKVDYYSEEVLNLHELEVEKLEYFYNENKRIFQLAAKHDELWEKLLHLEELASQSDRLFSNRGGRLLQEERERKLIQKKVPAVKEELVVLLEAYKASSGRDFLYYGVPLIETLKTKEEEREKIKENNKQQRKVANSENVLLESRLGSHPIAGNKRKMLTPQQPNITSKVIKLSAHSTTSSTISAPSSKSAASSRRQMLRVEEPIVNRRARSPTPVGYGGECGYAIPRTPVHTRTARNVRTPAPFSNGEPDENADNGSLSYESFQENIEKSNGQKVCRSSTKNPVQRILRPRNAINTNPKIPRYQEIPSKLTPYKTPKTPVRTPSKIPFRVATGSKIPSIVPPISPRSASKLTTPRSRLPIIF